MMPGRLVEFNGMKKVLLGTPANIAIAKLAEEQNAKRTVVIASKTLHQNTTVVRDVIAALGNRFAAICNHIPPHSPRQAVFDATTTARGAKADLIVTIGGGSVTDAGKAVTLFLANDIHDNLSLDRLRSHLSTRGIPSDCYPPIVPQIAVPSTLSAGEFSAISGLTDERSKIKELFQHPAMIPASVVLDPGITVHTPLWLFLSTGIRALDHAVEGYCSLEAHPYSDAQALHALRLLSQGLPRVHKNPLDFKARLDCQIGAWLSMAPVSTGVPMGASHGIGYVLGAAFGIPHGHTSCVMLPAVQQWNQTFNSERQAHVSAALSAPGEHAAVVLDRLISGLGLPRSLQSIGVGRDQFDLIATQAMSTSWVPRNPRPITSSKHILEILEIAAT